MCTHTHTHTHTYIYIYIYIQIKVELTKVVEGNPKTPFSLVTTPKCSKGQFRMSIVFVETVLFQTIQFGLSIVLLSKTVPF